MNSSLDFLIAAKRCEIAELHQLALTSALVQAAGALVHGLQRERGLCNLFLASQGTRFAAERASQIAANHRLEADLRVCLNSLDAAEVRLGHGARLFSRVAYVLQGLDALPALRRQLASTTWTPQRATQAYVRLISGLLAVVFEAADSASDPEVSRSLVALFNFMQGKEWAGQERATGSALLAAGRADSGEQQRLLHLIESQERCLQVFEEFSTPELRLLWAQAQEPGATAELERMRRILCTAGHGTALDAAQSQAWFDLCSERIERMKVVEDKLTEDLMAVCRAKGATVTDELQALLDWPVQTGAPAQALGFFGEPEPPDPSTAPGLPPAPPFGTPSQPYGPHLERSILELVREQALRLQAMGDELDTVRASLNERKLIERAKGLLMAHRQLSEEEAHKTLRQLAMNQNRRLIEVAEAVLSMAEVLPERRR